MRRIAVLTSGGDAPGMNAAIRAVVRTGLEKGWGVFGVRRGYAGLIAGEMVPLGDRDVGGIIQQGVTVLGSARCPEFQTEEGRRQALHAPQARDIGALVVIGGGGSQTGAEALSRMGFPVAGAGPYNLSHIHFAMVETTRPVTVDELRDALWDAPRIAFVRATEGLVALNAVIELMRDLDRSRGDMWEVAVWEDALAADEREVYLTYQVHNEAIVIPENVDCIRALTGLETDGAASVARTDAALGITRSFLPATTRPITHVFGPEVPHPAIEAVHATHREFMSHGFKGAEEPAEPVPTAAQGR